LAVLLPLIRLVFFLPWGEQSESSVGLVNAMIRTAVLLYIAFFMARVALMYEYRNKLREQELQEKIKKLEGFLPICASCKKIRDENNEYQVMEKFIEARSAAVFTHGLCPECLKKMKETM
jgi:hypothetical protein